MQVFFGELIFILKPWTGYYRKKILMMNNNDEEDEDYYCDDENNLANSIQMVFIHISAGAVRTTLILLIEDGNIPFNKTSHWKGGIVGNVLYGHFSICRSFFHEQVCFGKNGQNYTEIVADTIVGRALINYLLFITPLLSIYSQPRILFYPKPGESPAERHVGSWEDAPGGQHTVSFLG